MIKPLATLLLWHDKCSSVCFAAENTADARYTKVCRTLGYQQLQVNNFYCNLRIKSVKIFL